ncbi:MAG: helix-turn-helix transcriptional regulator [Clostridia bacterium]|nr:helix-turn-helix transcriptional regulator [Clostridia bacterium]
MYKKEVFEFLASGNNFIPTKILKQYWKRNSFSYMTTPRPDFGIMLLLKGQINFISKNQTLSVKAGDIIFLPKGCFYEAVFLLKEGDVENYLVNFDTEYALPPTCAPVKLFESATHACESFFKEMLDEHLSPDHTILGSMGRFYLLLNSIVNFQPFQNQNNNNLTSKACELLQKSEISIPDIAKECCISESGLRRLFRDTLGTSPLKYRNEFKLKQAAYMLEATDLSVSQIADELHFFDTAHFCKLFKSYFGITPKQYIQNKKL